MLALQSSLARFGVRWAGVGSVVIVPLILAWAGLELQSEFARVERHRSELDRSHAARAQIQQVFSLMQDAETGQRGYVITGQTQFLEPYQASQRQLATQLAALDRLFAGQREQEARLLRLHRLVDAKLRVNDLSISTRRDQGAAAAMAVVSGGQGKRVMDEIRGVIAEMRDAEAVGLRGQRAEADRLTARTRLMIEGLFAALVVILGGVAVLVRRTSKTRHRLLTEVQSQAARQRAVFDSTLDAIVTLNPSGSIESMNRSAQTLFGYGFSELSRRDIACLVDLGGGEGGSFLVGLNGIDAELRQGIVKQTVGRRQDGSTFPVEVALSEMPLPDGLHVVAAIRDISERKRVERMKDEFVSTVSHELRTPLTSIAGSLGLLRGGAAGPLPDSAARLISIAANNSERLVRLINDILDMEKIASGGMRFELEKLGMRGLVERSMEGLDGYADQFGVEIVLRPGSDVEVDGDADRLVQVLTNLLSNAVKFSPAGTAVEVSVDASESGARVSVRDQGRGIPEAFRNRIFSKFAQADSSDTRQKGGTGLGLAIAREIVEQHGGRVHFETEVGRGTIFHVDLPRSGQGRLAAADEAPRTPPLSALGNALPFVLHVEDDRDVAEVVASALAETAEVVTAPSLAAARKVLKDRTPDLIILDLGLPDGSGELLLPELNNGARTVPVVLYSAQDVDGRLRDQVSAALTKSRNSLNGLVSTVRRLTEAA